MLKLLAFVLCIASLVGRSEQAVLTCNLTDAGNPEDFQPDVRICDGFSNNTSNLMMYGSTQTLTVLELLNVDTYGREVGVCYSTSVLGCYQSGQDVEDCDNFIRDVIDLNGDCNDTYCKVLVCGTNALRAQCTMCEYNGSAITCDFDENVPAQSLPYNAAFDAGYSSCANNNTDGVGIFQFRKDDNATFLYDVGMSNEDGKIYYGLLKSDSQRNSIIGLASINKTTGEITGEVTTRIDSQKVVATEAHFMDSPFIRDEHVYFLFREPAQEFASLSQGQDPVINRYYSRIARICEDDQGVSVSSTQILTSFLKQRLVCSRTNDNNEVLEFNEIQDFEVVNDTIHAIFTTARDDAPLSALCTFDLTAIHQTFQTGDFFGADGGTTNDRWRANSGVTNGGTAITPRPGFSCSNPNTGNTNFQRDYNLMEDPAVQTNLVPIFLEGDRFSQLSLNGADYIIASERGCLYSVPIGSNVMIEPCEVLGMRAPIEDLEIASNKLLVTANDNVEVADFDTCIVEPPEPTACNLSPPGGSYVVRPNARFDIIYDATFISPNITQGDMEVTDSNDETAYLLIRDESLDLDGSLMHLGILILDETFVNFTQVPNCTYTIETYAHYTIGELEKRCDDYDAASAAHSAVNDSCADATMNNKGTFNSAILLNYNQVIDCENCAYSDCKDQC